MTDLATDPPTEIRATHRAVLPGVAMIAMSFGLARYGYGMLLPDIQRDVGIGATGAGLISSSSYVSYLVANVAVVGLTSRFGVRAAVSAAAACAALGMLLVAVAPGPVVLAAGVLLAGAASGFAFPPYADVVARTVREDRRDGAWSAISSGTGWGVAVAGPVAIAAGSQWRVAWLVFVGIAVVVGLWARAWAPGRTAGALRRPQLSPSWFLCPKSGPLLASAVLVGLGTAVFWAFAVNSLVDAGSSATAARATYAGCGVALVLGSLSGLLFARLGLRWGYLLTCAALAASLLGFAAGREHPAAAVVAATVFGSGYAAVIAAHGIWSARVFAGHPAAGLAAVNTALTLGTLAGPTAAGLVVDRLGYGWAFGLAGVAVLLALGCAPPSARQRSRLASHECRAAPVRP